MKDKMEIIKSSYCECDVPLIRTNENGGEYCAICNMNLRNKQVGYENI